MNTPEEHAAAVMRAPEPITVASIAGAIRAYMEEVKGSQITNDAPSIESKAAVDTLIQAGYTYNGGELWKPPLGQSASPLLEKISILEKALSILQSELHTERVDALQYQKRALTAERSVDTLTRHLADANRYLAEREAERDAAQAREREWTQVVSKLKDERDELKKARDDWRQSDAAGQEYIENIGRLLGCCDGDDTPVQRIISLKAERDAALARAEKYEKAAVPLCIGRAIIGHLARDGAWVSQDGQGAVAADELFHNDPYEKIATNNDDLRLAHTRYETIRKMSPRQFQELHWRAINLKGTETFDQLIDAMTVQQRENQDKA